ncbi:MAG: fibronectin type III domain-containing protein [Anaerolineae bacterium]|nr:fibronectin type III domain-containing protein [Anaerolineae bacterium]
MKRFAWLTLVLVLLALSACNRESPLTEILPLDDFEGEIQGPFVNAITGESVLIELSTSIPTNCKVKYGPDQQYGSTATNMMDGSRSLNHTITIKDLTPGTTYHYQLNLTDAEGRLYLSDDLTFTTASSD